MLKKKLINLLYTLALYAKDKLLTPKFGRLSALSGRLRHRAESSTVSLSSQRRPTHDRQGVRREPSAEVRAALLARQQCYDNDPLGV